VSEDSPYWIHDLDERCACVFCERVRTSIETAPAWDRKHQKCVDEARAAARTTTFARGLFGIVEPSFTERPFNHPSGQWYWKVCPCGAQHLRARDAAVVVNRTKGLLDR
jgi:hypothetical protein